MAYPCQCMLPPDGYTKVFIRKDVVATADAMMVVPKRQKLPNGVKLPNNQSVWIPYGNVGMVGGDGSVDIPNWKINELIKMLNVVKIKKGG